MEGTCMNRNPVAFESRLQHSLQSASVIHTLQINLGLVCNLACKHCHVESSPKRNGADENMSALTAEKIIEWLKRADSIRTVDFTGGSPEMNPQFRSLVQQCRHLGRHVIDRCNPTIIGHVDPTSGETYDWVPSFLADHQVEVFASLPCYLEDNVRKQRGIHAFDSSIEGLKSLNRLGYGTDANLKLNLVFNPTGPSLPPQAAGLEEDYRRELRQRYSIEFTRLITITNMPIARWRADLERQGKLESYENLLEQSFNPETVDGLMCRHQIHVDSQGRLSDCDFNYAMRMYTPVARNRHLWDFNPAELADRPIATANHCYGCTAGSGSSCGGAIA
jgi:radical SAM/Cys-rich protein